MEENKQVIENRCSCKIAINAKGNWSGELKAYGNTLEEAKLTALKHAQELEIIIKEKNNS